MAIGLICAAAATAVAQTTATNEKLLERAYALDAGEQQPRDAAAAAELYRQAAEAGDALAHLRLGYLTEIGDGVPQDYAAARAHYEAAVRGGLNEARLRLAICHLEGWGGPVDRAAFAREVRAAAEANYLPAQRMLASLLMLGFAVPEDRDEAVKWLDRAAAQDDSDAQYQLGRRSEQLTRLARNPDLALARNWYQLSAENEYRASMLALARTFLVGERGQRNWELGYKWLELATAAGDSEAPYVLAISEMLHPDVPRRDADRAREWLKAASARGNARATEVIELESDGRSLANAMRFVLNTPFEDRYVQRAAAKAGDAPTRPPVIYRVVRPIYPRSLRLVEEAGDVIVEFVVDTTGRVADAKVVKSSHPLFSERALEAVRQWRFHPGRRDNRLVHTRMQVPVYFRLEDEEMAGVDGLLRAARSRAQALGPEVAADARDLRLAKPKRKAAALDAARALEIPPEAAALLLLVLDETGRPIRGHVLHARPKSFGPELLAVALQDEYEPRVDNGGAVVSNVVLPFTRKPAAAPVQRAK